MYYDVSYDIPTSIWCLSYCSNSYPMEEVPDIKSYLYNTKIKENVSSALEEVLKQSVLPYNPYTSLVRSFLKNSEYYVIAESHLQLGTWQFTILVDNVIDYFIINCTEERCRNLLHLTFSTQTFPVSFLLRITIILLNTLCMSISHS